MSDVQVSNGTPAAMAPPQAAASTAVMKLPPANPPTAPAPESVTATPAFRVDPQRMRQQLTEAVQQLNSQMEKTNTALGFQVDEVAGRNVITVRNKETGDVVRQIPGDAVLAVAYNIERLRGLLFNGKA